VSAGLLQSPTTTPFPLLLRKYGKKPRSRHAHAAACLRCEAAFVGLTLKFFAADRVAWGAFESVIFCSRSSLLLPFSLTASIQVQLPHIMSSSAQSPDSAQGNRQIRASVLHGAGDLRIVPDLLIYVERLLT
jgi:hypothetical protein